MIGDGKKYHYLAVTNLSGLLKGILSNHKEDFYCLNCFNSYTKKNKLKEHEEICNNHDRCRTETSEQDISKHNPGEKSLKAPYTLYLDFECILKKVQSCQNNPEKSYTEQIARHEPSGRSLLLNSSFDKKENKLNYYRGKDCAEKVCKKFRERVMEVINYKKRDIIPLSQEEINFYNEQEISHICKHGFCEDKDDKDYINRKKVKDHCHIAGKYRGAVHSKCNLNYKVQKEIPVIIHNASYDTHFIINQLAIEFNAEINCIGDNMENYITFSVPIKKELNNGKAVTYKLKFIDSNRFMDSSLSDLVHNTSEIFKSGECKSCIEKIKINSECCFTGLKSDRIICKCRECKKEWKESIKELN